MLKKSSRNNPFIIYLDNFLLVYTMRHVEFDGLYATSHWITSKYKQIFNSIAVILYKK
ncbi:hypothetical protein DSUL_20227 [Desulfovibrionales bacterium]